MNEWMDDGGGMNKVSDKPFIQKSGIIRKATTCIYSKGMRKYKI